MQSGSKPEFEPVPLLEALNRGGVDYVVIGGVAAGGHGSAIGTLDLDVAYARDRENLERLAEVLRGLGATLRGTPPNVPFQLDADALSQGGNFTFATPLGSLDILAYPAGAPAYDTLVGAATMIQVGGMAVWIASIDHLIAMKEAAGRPKDKTAAMELRLLSDELHPGGT